MKRKKKIEKLRSSNMIEKLVSHISQAQYRLIRNVLLVILLNIKLKLSPSRCSLPSAWP